MRGEVPVGLLGISEGSWRKGSSSYLFVLLHFIAEFIVVVEDVVDFYI